MLEHSGQPGVEQQVHGNDGGDQPEVTGGPAANPNPYGSESPAAPALITRHSVAQFRQTATANGYSLIRVETSGKKPLIKGWQNGDADILDIPAGNNSLNTGMLIKDGLAVLDFDTDRPEDTHTAVDALKANITLDQLRQMLIRFRITNGHPTGLAFVFRCTGVKAQGIEADDHDPYGIRRKVEVITSKHLVVDGLHQSGARIEFYDGRSPATVSFGELVELTVENVDAVMQAIGAATGFRAPRAKATSNVIAPPETRPTVFNQHHNLPDMNAAAQGNMPNEWFGKLAPENQNEMLREIAAHPDFKALADQPRDVWLQLIFGFADAFAKGATEADGIARTWSMTSPRFTEEGFNTAWNSFKVGRGTTVGTLIHQATNVGFDVAPWRDQALTPSSTTVGNSGSTIPPAMPDAPPPFFQPVQTDPQYLHPVDWIILGLLQRGALAILAGAGGTAKTAFAICIAVLIAAGRLKIGPFTVQGTDLRVAMLSAEEPANRVNLLTAAAGSLHKLTAAEWLVVNRNFVQHDATKSGWRLGEPRSGHREDIAPETVDAAFNALRAALTAHPVDVLILDTLSALIAIPNEIDNGMVTQLLRRLVKLAQKFNCAIVLLHHSQKKSRENLASSAGDPEMIRGGSAITNVARVALTITGMAEVDATRAILAGVKREFVRVITQAKSNDAAFIDPVFITTKSVSVKMANGTTQDVRAVEFITLPPLPAPGASPIATPQSTCHAAARQAVLAAIQQGVPDAQGARVPIAPAGTGPRSASTVLAQAIQGAIGCSNKDAAQIARQEVDELLKLKKVVDQVVRLPLYKPDGSQNGTRAARGLEVVPGVLPPAPSPQPTVPGQRDVPDATQVGPAASDSTNDTVGNADDP